MRYRVKTYTAGITSDQLEFKVEFPIPEKVAELLESHKTETYGTVDAAAQKWLLESIRVIADETQGGYILAGTGFRSNIAGLNWWWHNNPTTVAFYFDFDTLIANANGDPDDLAAIAALSGSDSLTVEMDFGDLPPEYLESTDDAHNLAQFFNLPDALPSDYHAMTTAEVLEIADEEWLAMYGFVAVQNTLHTVNALGQQVEIATYFKTSRTYGDYGFPELWAQNDQQQWVSILNDNPTADRDIYTYNPSNNE